MNKSLLVGFTVSADVSDARLLSELSRLRDYVADMTLETARLELLVFPFGTLKFEAI